MVAVGGKPEDVWRLCFRYVFRCILYLSYMFDIGSAMYDSKLQYVFFIRYIYIYVLIRIQLLLYLHMLYIFVSMFEILFMYFSCHKICLTGVSAGCCRLKNEGT